MSTNGYNGNCNFQSQPPSNGQSGKIGGQQFAVGAAAAAAQQQQQQQINAVQQQQQIQSPNFNQSANKTQNHKEKLDEIRQQLQPYMINERPTSSASSTSETSSNYVKHGVHGGLYDAQSMIYQHQQANYYPPNYGPPPPPPLNYPGQSNQLAKYLVNGQLIDYYKQNGFKTDAYCYTPSNASDKQSPTPLNGSNNGRLVSSSLISSCSSSLSFAPLPNLVGEATCRKTAAGNTHNSNNHHPGNNLTKSELTSPIDDHLGQQFACNNPPNSSMNSSMNSAMNSTMNSNLLCGSLADQPPCTNLQTAKLQAWSVRQTKSQSPVIMQSVKSTQVQKPVLQTACAPIANGPHSQQQPQPSLINSSGSSNSMLNPYQRSLNSRMAFNEKSLKTDLVQLNPNIAKKFLSKVIGLETEPEASLKPAGGYQKQQMPLPDPPKSSISNSPVYSVISDKSNLSSNLTANLNGLAIRTSSALSNCSGSSKFTSYSNASSINQPPPYKPPGGQFLGANQTVHAKPATVKSNFVEEPRPPPSYCESILNSSTSSSSNYITTSNIDHHHLTNLPDVKLTANNLIVNSNLMLNQQPVDPPSYASSVAVLIKQKNAQIDLMNSKAKNGAIKINRPLPPLPSERPEELRSASSTPVQQTGPPLPPKPSKLAPPPPPPPEHAAYMTDDLDCSSAAFNATSNLQLLQKQLEQHLQQQRPLVEKLKQIHLQKHQQKVLSNLKASSHINNQVNQAISQQQQQQKAANQQTNQQANQQVEDLPPVLPAKNSNNNGQQGAKSIAAMKRPVPAPPLMPKKEHLLNKNRPRNENALNAVPSVPPEKPAATAKQNEYENTLADGEANSGSFHANDEQNEDEVCNKTTHHSPIPLRKFLSKEREQERRESKVKNYSSAAYRFFMEQHIENVIKSQQQRENRKNQLENEMLKAKLTNEAQSQMRKMLQQKESNYIRLKRARMEKSMFEKIQTLGVGAFGK